MCLPPDTGKDADVGGYGPWTRLEKHSSSPFAAVPSHRPQAGKACEFGPWSNLQELDQPQTQSQKRRKVDTLDLSNACVVDVPACVRTAPPQTKAAQKASDKEAIKARWLGPGRCVCAAHKSKKPNKGPACHRALPLTALLRTCLALAAMSSEEKGFIFHFMYNQNSDPSRRQDVEGGRSGRHQWAIEGHRLCFTNFAWLLFTSPDTIREFVQIEAGPDGKRISKRSTGLPSGRRKGSGAQGMLVDFFFQEYYQSSAEPLPKASTREGHLDSDIQRKINGKWGPWLNKGDRLNDVDDDQYDPDRPCVDVQRMLTLACSGAVVGLPVRFIQHSTLTNLYWQFLAHWDTLNEASRSMDVKRQGLQKPPSFATFERRWDEVWRHYLRFRKSSEHAQCNTCFKLHKVMHDRGSSVAEKLDAARHLREHISNTYLDRQIYWNLRWASRCHQDVLVIIIDSMDKTKFAWPRYPFPQRPHDLADIVRPRVSFTVAMAHGYCVDMYMAPEELNQGSDAFMAVLCRSISNVRRICGERNRPFPRHLVIQSDNTVSQAKNQHVVLFLAFLVSRGLFLSVSLNFLVVGHTHEDIGDQG